jgi:hypothetical protein
MTQRFLMLCNDALTRLQSVPILIDGAHAVGFVAKQAPRLTPCPDDPQEPYCETWRSQSWDQTEFFFYDSFVLPPLIFPLLMSLQPRRTSGSFAVP